MCRARGESIRGTTQVRCCGDEAGETRLRASAGRVKVSVEGLKTGCCCLSGCSWYELIGRGRHYREEPKLAEEPRNTQNSRQSQCRSIFSSFDKAEVYAEPAGARWEFH